VEGGRKSREETESTGRRFWDNFRGVPGPERGNRLDRGVRTEKRLIKTEGKVRNPGGKEGKEGTKNGQRNHFIRK